jgi:Domain of unknown function (DUF4157)
MNRGRRRGNGRIRQANVTGPVREMTPATEPAAHDILRLQREVGNRAVAGLLQAKLNVSQPGDPDEREADEVADHVVSMAPSAAGEPIRRQARSSNIPAADVDTVNVEDRIHATKGSGSPLSHEVRRFFEPRMQSDFSGVRVHTDSEAARLNRALDARAFATGRDIYFGAGEFRPDTVEGRRLLAHELTHVVQQGGAPQERVQRAAKASAAEWSPSGAGGYTVTQNAISSKSGDVAYSFDEIEGVILPGGGSDLKSYRKNHPAAKIHQYTHYIAVWVGTDSSRKLGIRFGLDFSYDNFALGDISCHITKTYDWPMFSGAVSVNLTPMASTDNGVARVRITLSLDYQAGFGNGSQSKIIELDATGKLEMIRGSAHASLEG